MRGKPSVSKAGRLLSTLYHTLYCIEDHYPSFLYTLHQIIALEYGMLR